MTIKILLLCTFINGMLHLAYLGQMLEKGGRFTVRIFPKGWYLVRIVLIYSNGVHLCIFKRVGDHHHVPYSHNCDCDQSGVNGQDELLAAGLGSIYLTVNS